MSKFTDKLALLGFETYDDYLNSPHWFLFKQRYFSLDLPKNCLVCGSPFVQLHHITYVRLGAEGLDDVVPLCQRHHQEVHFWLKEHKRFVGKTYLAIREIRRLGNYGRHERIAKRYSKKKLTRSDRQKQHEARCEKSRVRKLPKELRIGLPGWCKLCGGKPKKKTDYCRKCLRSIRNP